MPGRNKLTEITGLIEQSVSGIDTGAAVGLLDRLVEPEGENWSSAALSTFERDRLLAGLYGGVFGDRIESTVRCRSCERPFDISFSLEKLADAAAPRLRDGVTELPDGSFRLLNGSRFRLPTGTDELEVARLRPEDAAAALRERCLLEGSGEGMEEAMENVAPILHRELEARCPECGAQQAVEFDLQTFLLEALRAEQGTLIREIHRIAIAYGWSLTEILGLTRSQRRRFVDWIEAERRPARKVYP